MPVFPTWEYHFCGIQEVNMTTIRIEAIDSDEPNTQNSRVLYRLAGENSDLFSINFDTGIITVARGMVSNKSAQV